MNFGHMVDFMEIGVGSKDLISLLLYYKGMKPRNQGVYGEEDQLVLHERSFKDCVEIKDEVPDGTKDHLNFEEWL